MRYVKIECKGTKYGYKMRCLACTHTWFPKLITPLVCPQCGTRLEDG